MNNKTQIWSDGILSACKYLGLPELPNDIETTSEPAPLPSDFLGNNFELDHRMIESLKKSCRLSDERYDKVFTGFRNKYKSQKIFKHNSTDFNIFFCDFLLSARKRGYSISNYFDFEFYRKSLELQNTFRGEQHRGSILVQCNESGSINMVKNKSNFNNICREYVLRDWLDASKCSVGDFRFFVDKHPRFFIKPNAGSLGEGAKIINVDKDSDITTMFETYKEQRMIIEEVIVQHELLSEFCPDTLNTVRVNTFFDKHDKVHVLTACGRFGRLGNVVDNFHGGGYSVVIDPLTGRIISDGINRVHQRVAQHPDTGKKFRGFQYPCWEDMRAALIKMARRFPTLRHIGWDVAITHDGRIEFVEGNHNPDTDVQQAADSIGKMHIYKTFVEEYVQFKREQIESLGYRINGLRNFDVSYEILKDNRRDRRVKFVLENLIDGCKSLLDVGCRESKAVKNNCPAEIEYHAVDYKKYDDEVIECDFNVGSFPDLVVDTCLSIYTAEYVELLPEFLDNLCRAARHQVLMLCRPVDKEIHARYRWRHPFAVDFTEAFLLNSLERNGFYLHQNKSHPDNRSVILYDFRRKV